MDITLPSNWQELTDKQLYYVYSLMAENLSSTQIKTYCFFRWGGIKVVETHYDSMMISKGKERGIIPASVIASAVHHFDFIDEFPATPVRLSKINGHRAIDATLAESRFPLSRGRYSKSRFTFEKYLYCDNLYQQYLTNQNHQLLIQMAQLLYDHPEIKLSRPQKLSIFYWWASLKSLLSRVFVNLYVPMSTSEMVDGGENLASQLLESTNAQIRALTGGDISKQRAVLDSDVWTALGELDAKAKESAEIQAGSNTK